MDYISNAQIPGEGGIPKVVIFLTADAFGVLPPISRLSKEAAMYHFVTGFTSKLAGTERGITEPQPTFSTLFGEPFMPMDPQVYAKMLGDKLDQYGTKVYLVNTGLGRRQRRCRRQADEAELHPRHGHRSPERQL